MLSYGVADHERTRTFARYSLIGSLSMAVGALAVAIPDFLTAAGVGRVAALQAMFYGYAVLGLVSAAIYHRLPHAHIEQRPAAVPLTVSRGVVYKLAALFSVDAFAGGFVVQSLLAVWLFQRFNMSLSAASVFLFLVERFERVFLSAGRAHRQIYRAGEYDGVYAHSVEHLSHPGGAVVRSLGRVALLLVRSALSQMDVPTRTSYVMAVVTPPERAAAASVTAVPRSLASSLSPALAGVLLTTSFSGLPLVVCGVLKIGLRCGSAVHVSPHQAAGGARVICALVEIDVAARKRSAAIESN